MLVNIISSPRAGGAELLVRELHKIHSRRGMDVRTIYLNGSAEDREQGEIFLGVNLRSPLNILRIRRILKILSAKCVDEMIVHAHLTWPFLYTALASFGLQNIKLVHTEHATTNRRRDIPMLWVLEKMLYARYSRTICISEGVHAALAQWVGPKVAQRLVTVPNGSRIYSLAERPALVGRLPRLVSVGSLSSWKNFATAIRAVARLKDEVESYTIVGEGPDRFRLERLITAEQLEDKVNLVGWSDNIEAHLHDADIQIIPSLWEGFGLVAVEGMSTGLPVVASDVAGLREVLDPCNPSVILIQNTESREDWVAGIRKCITDLKREGAHALAHSSRGQAEKFTLEKMADRYLHIYRQILRDECDVSGL